MCKAFPSSMFLVGTDSREGIWAVAAMGGTEAELGRKVRTKPGLKARRRGMELEFCREGCG